MTEVKVNIEKNDWLEANGGPADNRVIMSKPAPPAVSNSARFMKILPWAGIVVVLLVAGIVGGMQYKKVQKLNQQVSELKKNPQQAAEDQTNEIIAKVGKLIVLPEDERPTLATVTDPAALKEQPFFAKAEVGDKVLIYTNARKAILYSERDNKIKEVAPINIGSSGDNKDGTVAGSSTNSNSAPQSNTNTNSNSNNSP